MAADLLRAAQAQAGLNEPLSFGGLEGVSDGRTGVSGTLVVLGLVLLVLRQAAFPDASSSYALDKAGYQT